MARDTIYLRTSYNQPKYFGHLLRHSGHFVYVNCINKNVSQQEISYKS